MMIFEHEKIVLVPNAPLEILEYGILFIIKMIYTWVNIYTDNLNKNGKKLEFHVRFVGFPIKVTSKMDYF